MGKRSEMKVNFWNRGNRNGNYERKLYRAILAKRLSEKEGEEFFVRSHDVSGIMGVSGALVGAYLSETLWSFLFNIEPSMHYSWLIIGIIFFIVGVIKGMRIDDELVIYTESPSSGEDEKE